MRKEKTDIVAALIVGGKSRRFGALKQLAIWDRQSLLEHSLRLAQKLSDSIIAVTGPHTFNLPKNIPQYKDLLEDKGPMGGIYTALCYTEAPYCIMIPCDMPMLDASIYQLLLEYIPTEVPIVAQSHRGVEPLVSIWPRLLLPRVKQSIQQNKLKLLLLLEELHARFLPLEEIMENYNPIYFSNINTREDLEKLRQHNGK